MSKSKRKIRSIYLQDLIPSEIKVLKMQFSLCYIPYPAHLLLSEASGRSTQVLVGRRQSNRKQREVIKLGSFPNFRH